MARLRNRYLLFVDLLGAKAQWQRQGRVGAEAAFRQLRDLVATSLQAVDHSALIDGLIETDAAAIVCSSVEHCLTIGLEVFRKAFFNTNDDTCQRLWLRGVITQLPQYAGLRSLRSLPRLNGRIKVSDLAPGLLDAISVEKSGFKGMRLLITASLITRPLLDRFVIAVGSRHLAPFKTLAHSHYPTRLGRDFEDVFWMLQDSEAQWEQAKQTMALRLRLAARDPEEFIQAASTQVLFHECSAIVWNLRRRSGITASGNARGADIPQENQGVDGNGSADDSPQ
jgi:hypothetical protein